MDFHQFRINDVQRVDIKMWNSIVVFGKGNSRVIEKAAVLASI
jgi:hypothetical protein